MGLISDFLIDAAKDAAKDKALDVAEDKFVGESDDKGGCLSNVLRFFISLIWLIVVLGIDLLSALSTLWNPIIGAGLEFGVFIITMCIPYLRKKGTLTRLWGWLALLSAFGLIGMMFAKG